MHKQRLKTIVSLLFILPLLVLAPMPACQQLCQPLSQTPYQNLSDTQWRLVETSNPNVQVTLFNFLVLSFSNDFTGQVLKVVNNQEYTDPPIEVFTWVVPPGTQGSGDLRIQYSSPPTGDSGDNGTDQQQAPQVISTDDYTFNLTNQLELTEQTTGYTWQFVPMTGIVPPDSNCTF